DLAAAERVCIDYAGADELAAKAAQALKAIESGNPAAWKALQGRGIFRGSGAAGKVAFLYTGQGSQYPNMLAELRQSEPVVAATFDEADAIMRPLLGGRALSEIIFVGADGVAGAEAELMRTEITQPAVLTVDVALTRLLAAYGIEPDFVMGHSLGEYAALVAAGVLPFSHALEAVSARGREMASLSVEDNGAMAAVSAPIEEVEQIVAEVDGYVVLANVNSSHQLVIGGATAAVERAIDRIVERGHRAQRLPVSHAFHTEIVAPASEPLRTMLRRLTIAPPRIPVVANVDGEFYPSGPDVAEQIVEILGRQVASPVQFVRGLRTLFDAGARVFVETGPKRALWGFAADVLGDDAVSLFTNHPKVGELASFNQALCGLYAAGVGAPVPDAPALREDEPVVVTGASVGTPGTEKLFDDGNLSRLLHGEQFIDSIPASLRREIAERHITRLVKGDDGSGSFQTIDDPAEVIKLAGRGGEFDLAEEFGIDPERLAALGRETQMALAAGLDALRDAGIPLVQHYKTTTRGTQLPDKWRLADSMQDDTGVIFASAYPGVGDFVKELNAFWGERVKHARLKELREVRGRADAGVARDDIDRRIAELERDLDQHAYQFDRRFLFRTLSMGHSQFAELIGARGPNTQINAACASTTQAVSVAEDWIRTGRCSRVVIVAADDVTSEALLPWVGSGFLASGAAATDEVVEDAALPFDQRRHGMILGMGAVGIVVESAAAARERGVTPICEVLGAVTANSAFHGSRLDVDHIGAVMESVVQQAEARGVKREEIAPETVFVSHETYTPARGGSAAAEIFALRRVFGEDADKIVIANTKGLTGHSMGVGIEDVTAIKALETGLIPAVPNFRDVDPELGALNLSKGGLYPVRYALRLGAGFGSQISMVLLRWTPVRDGRRRTPEELGYGYRIADETVWKTWLRGLTGQDEPQLEVTKRNLRVVDTGPAANGARRAPVAAPAAASPPIVEPEPVAIPAPVSTDEITGAVLEIV
ncbi:MAG TPA: acyltransferase domain-containing protein, partial [Solirubrobacter sp.]